MKIALMAAAVLLSASAASAATITVEKITTPISVAAAQQDVLAPTTVTSGFYENVTGSVSLIRRSPFDTIAELAETGKYHSVQSGWSASYEFDAAQESFSLIWGSPDTYNSLSFFLGADQIDLSVVPGVAGMSITGADVALLPLTQPEQVGLANVVFSGFLFDRVVFASTGNAFEFAMVSSTPAPVPLPAAAWMMMAALGGLFAAGRRRAAA